MRRPHDAGAGAPNRTARRRMDLKAVWNVHYALNRKGKARLLILLLVIWVVVTLPLPWVVGNPDIPETQVYTILGIIGIISVPFVLLAVVWTLKPELTT